MTGRNPSVQGCSLSNKVISFPSYCFQLKPAGSSAAGSSAAGSSAAGSSAAGSSAAGASVASATLGSDGTVVAAGWQAANAKERTSTTLKTIKIFCFILISS